jgi:arabinose-5-phosphate isomerase
MEIQERIAAILEAEAAAIRSVGVTAQFERAVCELQRAQGPILTTGMGKAGYVARKFAATLCSTGSPATYVHPAEAAHGDLGMIGGGEPVVAFSTSGKTREVLEMLGAARRIGIGTVIGVTSHADSALRNLSDIVIDMGVIREPCPLGLTPSASIAVMLAISDAIALVLLELKGLTARDFGLRHHGGYLGQAAMQNENVVRRTCADWSELSTD